MNKKIVSLEEIEHILFNEPEKHSDFYLIELIYLRWLINERIYSERNNSCGEGDL